MKKAQVQLFATLCAATFTLTAAQAQIYVAQWGNNTVGEYGMNGGAINSTFVKEYKLYAFVDGGRVWDAGGVIKPSLASVGAGLRFLLGNDLQGNIAIATPIHYTTRTNNLQDVRILFSLSKSFKWCPSWNSWRCS